MIAHRFTLSSTTRNADALVALLRASETQIVRLFATTSDISQAQASDGAATNFPLMAALVDYRIPGISDMVSIVFDGVFLTAQRSPRAAEIRDVLDVAVANGHVVFGMESVPFTSSLSPEKAIGVLMSIPTTELTEGSRPTFWSMLSSLSEQAR
ncbi:hypothetical protein [Agrobacterium rosae]|uniref:Uncharacterized protein n=1 Tax=Agrobacterium rosae TaxID=1972867 RepID=A0A1R3U9Y6_9HYPH|nr:hypothetical protein [Agrobacterium rosae]SCX35878.1 hypothetical protein DSM25559_5196 [Agrobacterium rosae]